MTVRILYPYSKVTLAYSIVLLLMILISTRSTHSAQSQRPETPQPNEHYYNIGRRSYSNQFQEVNIRQWKKFREGTPTDPYVTPEKYGLFNNIAPENPPFVLPNQFHPIDRFSPPVSEPEGWNWAHHMLSSHNGSPYSSRKLNQNPDNLKNRSFFFHL